MSGNGAKNAMEAGHSRTDEVFRTGTDTRGKVMIGAERSEQNITRV